MSPDSPNVTLLAECYLDPHYAHHNRERSVADKPITTLESRIVRYSSELGLNAHGARGRVQIVAAT